MTDWNEICENISRATQESEKFARAGKAVIESPEEIRIREFAERLSALQEELGIIQKIIGPGSPIALDAISDSWSKSVLGHPSRHRLTPKIPEKEKADS